MEPMNVSGFHAFPFDNAVCLHQLAEWQAASHPHGVAVVDTAQSLSYAELEMRACELARAIIESQPTLRAGGLVGIFVARSVVLPVGVFGIMKAGCGYVALSDMFPSARKALILEDSNAQAVVLDVNVAWDLVQGASLRPTIMLDATGAVVDRRGALGDSRHVALSQVASSAVAYCCYTSGSTGKPKGIVVEHINAVSQIHWFNSTKRLFQDGTLLGVTELTHDPAVIELFWPPMCGARHYVVSANERRDGLALKRLIVDERVDVIQATPFTFYTLSDVGWVGSSRLAVFCGGEPVPTALSQDFEGCNSFTNIYGPTETTVWATFHVLEQYDWGLSPSKIPVGKPIYNTAVMVLGDQLQLLPTGEMGEMYIGGIGMTRE